MKKTALISLLLLSLLINNTCYASSSLSVDKQSIYEEAILLVSWGEYAEALYLLEQAKNFSDSNKWADYCRGMIAIETANEYEKVGYRDKAISSLKDAVYRFSILPVSQFPDSEKLIRYCNARCNQLNGLFQPALDEYAELVGILDSYERMKNLYIPLPTQVPKNVLPAFLPLIPAKAVKKINTYLGPGNNYSEQNYIEINQDSDISICGREQDYFLIEIITENGKLRLWAPTLRIVRTEDKPEPQIGSKSRKALILRDTKTFMGPGIDYIESEIMIKKGEKVLAYDTEGEFTMIEYSGNQTIKSIRLWVFSEDLSN